MAKRSHHSKGGIPRAGLSGDIAAWIAATQDKADAVVRETLKQMAESLVDLTPAGDPTQWLHKWEGPRGYEGGNLKANWQFGVRQKPAGTTTSIDKTGEATKAEIAVQIDETVLGDTCYFVNNAPYSLIIEYGWSRQAPAGMARITIESWNQFLSTAVDDVTNG